MTNLPRDSPRIQIWEPSFYFQFPWNTFVHPLDVRFKKRLYFAVEFRLYHQPLLVARRVVVEGSLKTSLLIVRTLKFSPYIIFTLSGI